MRDSFILSSCYVKLDIQIIFFHLKEERYFYIEKNLRLL